jgi:hypothetical protein
MPAPQPGVSGTDITGPINLQFQSQLAAQQQQAAQAAQRQNQLMQAGATAALMFCSRRFKKPIGKEEGVLDNVDKLPVERWTYKDGLNLPHGEHISPYAEEFKELFGVGDGTTINVIDAFGVCIGAIKELSAKVKQLEAQNA